MSEIRCPKVASRSTSSKRCLGTIITFTVTLLFASDTMRAQAPATMPEGSRSAQSAHERVEIAKNAVIDILIKQRVAEDALKEAQRRQPRDDAAIQQLQAGIEKIFVQRRELEQKFAEVAEKGTASDYEIAPGDLLEIRVMELTAAGKESIFIKRVANSGIITAPYVNTIKVVGLSEAQAEAALREAYKEHQVLSDPVVSVLVVEGSDGKRVPAALLAGGAENSDDASRVRSATQNTADAQIAKLREKVEALQAAIDVVDGARNGERVYAQTDQQQQVAEREPFFALLLKQREAAQKDLDKLKAIQGADSPLVVKAAGQLDSINKQVQTLAEMLAKQPEALPANQQATTAPSTAPTS